MIKFIRAIIWVFQVLNAMGHILVEVWEPCQRRRRRSERQWAKFEQGARVRWAYAMVTEEHNELFERTYTAGPL